MIYILDRLKILFNFTITQSVGL